MKVILALLVVLLSFSPASAQQQVTPPSNLQIIGLLGQSNPVGENDLPNGANLLGPANSYVLTQGGQWWSPAFDPSASTEAVYGGSLYPTVWEPNIRWGRGYAANLTKAWAKLNPGTNIGLVNVAKGGTRIIKHLPGTPLYSAIRSQLIRARGYGQIAGIIWIQGEADTRAQEDAQAWGDNFVTLVSALRAEFGATLPVVYVMLGDPPDPATWPYWHDVQVQQINAETRLPNLMMVRALGYLKNPLDDGTTGLHYNVNSTISMSEDLARALYILRNWGSPYASRRR